jgi:3-isopropylmalate/(R)-2-methylmalate dehydratase small subunit
MTPFTTLEGVACPLPMANVDTDQIIPARFLKRPRSEGYGGFLLHDLRFGADGSRKSTLSLDDPGQRGARIIVARRNFGCGSSREAAVYALADFGIACVIAPSFGDIFANNCIMNGLLPATLLDGEVEELLSSPQLVEGLPIKVDLTAERISCGNKVYSLRIDPFARTKLLNGWDDIDVTANYAANIARFVAADSTRRPWALPARPTADDGGQSDID